MKMVDRWKADPPKFKVVKKQEQKFPTYPERKTRKRVKDMTVEEQKARYFSLTGIEPTDAQLEMALDLNLL